MDILVGVIIGLLVLMALVTLHEFGHFIMARRSGVKVLEFGICFPPRAIAWVKDPKTKKWQRLPKSEWKKPQEGLIFSLNWLPIGGFCQMDGESAADTRKGTFGAASFKNKTKILFGGVAMNWLAAWVILTVLAVVGMPEIFPTGQFSVPADTRVEYTEPILITVVAEDSPAAQAEIEQGDLIIAVDGNNFRAAQEVQEYNQAHAGEEVVYTIERAGEEFEKTILLNPADAEYQLGVAMYETKTLYATWSAPIVGAGLTVQTTVETFKGVGQMLWNLISGVGAQFSFDSSVRETGQAAMAEVGDSVSGPIGIIGNLFPQMASEGPAKLALLAAVISISLACMNVLPIPALDGGRWLLIAIYKLRKKKLTKETEEKIVARSMLVLLALIALVTILDVVKIAN